MNSVPNDAVSVSEHRRPGAILIRPCESAVISSKVDCRNVGVQQLLSDNASSTSGDADSGVEPCEGVLRHIPGRPDFTYFDCEDTPADDQLEGWHDAQEGVFGYSSDKFCEITPEEGEEENLRRRQEEMRFHAAPA